jgi:hypothetical protein
VDTKKLAQEARTMVASGEAENITEAIATVVGRALTQIAGTFTDQALHNWITDVTRVERAARTFYAIVYAYGRNVVNNGQRADHIYRFTTEAERTRFIDEQEQDADPIAATHPLVKKALRYAEHLDWPQAV